MKIFVFIALITLFWTCSKNDLKIVCDVDNPLTDLDWLSKQVEVWDKVDPSPDTVVVTISKAILEEKATGDKIDGFLIEVRASPESFPVDYYNCNGDKICYFSGTGEPYKECNEYKVLELEEIYQH